MYLAALENKSSSPDPAIQGRAAWLTSLPPLSGTEGIRDFIACVAFGMANEVIPPEKVARLLYAAQTALTLESQIHRRPAGRPASEPAKETKATQPATPDAAVTPQPTAAPVAE